MTEPVPTIPGPPSASSAILATALAASGLDPWLLFFGMVGGIWSLSYLTEPLTWQRRTVLLFLAAIVGAVLSGFLAPPLAALAAYYWSWWPPDSGGRGMRIAASLIVGLLTHRQIGPALMRRAEKAAE